MVTGMPPDQAKEPPQDADLVFQALAHPSRRRILLLLHYRGGKLSAGEIAGCFECSWPTTTRHLGVLLEARLVEKRRQGRQRIYFLGRQRLLSVTSSWLEAFQAG